MIRNSLAAAACCLVAACASNRPPDHVSLPPAPPPGEPAGLVGLASMELRTQFGAPAFVRKDGATQMWRYDGAACRAFFFLYPEGGALAVRHVETLPRGANIAADTTCLDLLRGRPQPVS